MKGKFSILLFPLLEDEGSVYSAESEVVRHDVVAVDFHALACDVAERSALRIEVV